MIGNAELRNTFEIEKDGLDDIYNAGKKLEKVENPSNLSNNLKNTELPNFQKRNLNIKEESVNSIKKTQENFVEETKTFSYEILNIKGIDSNESGIPLEHRDQIINEINKLGEFETIVIRGTTDASPILGNGIIYNRDQFNQVRDLYVSRGGTCPTYEELLQSSSDPQNTILGYRRAMQGIISLNLTTDQIKKVEISNALGNSAGDSRERGFEVIVNYSETVTNIVYSYTEDFFYNLLGDLKLQNLSYVDTGYADNYGTNYSNGAYTYNLNREYSYQMSNLDLSTHIDGQMTHLFNRVVGKLPDFLRGDELAEQKVKKQIESYLNSLISICGGKYNNGTRNADSLTKKQYYLIKLVNDKILSSEEFSRVLNGDKTVLLDKQLSNGKSIQEFLEAHKDNPVESVRNETRGIYRYYTNNDRLLTLQERSISQKDYLLLGLYFQNLKS